MKHILTILVFLCSFSASASECLEQAKNSELLRELENRLEDSSLGSIGQVEVLCDSGVLRFSHLSSAAEESSYSVDLRSRSECQIYLTQIGTNLRISALKTVAVCSGTFLFRVAFTPSTLKRLIPQEFRQQQDCKLKSKEINERL